MKKIITLLIVVITALYFHSRTSKVAENGDLFEIRRALSGEQFGPFDTSEKLYIIVGIDYIPFELIELFREITGIKVVVDIFDSNEILESKLLAGNARYDLVFPTAWPHFSRQLNAKIYQPLDKSRIKSNIFYKDIMEKLAQFDPDNTYALPFQFGISGIGLDENIVNKLLPNAPKDSLALIFDPENARKLSNYRISLYDSPNELFPALLAYLGYDPTSDNEEEIVLAANHLKKIRPYIAKFSSFGFEDLASGNACITLSTSGDIFKVRSDNHKPNIKFFSPKEGASLWVDVVAIPSGAQNLNNAYAFLKFLFHPRVIAEVTNRTSRANAVEAAISYVDPALASNQDIYPSQAVRQRCYIEKPLKPEIERLKTRLLTKIKSMEY